MKRAVYLLAVLAVLGALSAADALIFSRCGLARELYRQGFPANQLNDWVCLVESESSRNTASIGRQNNNFSYDHGLFQISDKYWCRKGKRGGGCNVSCESLRSDDIRIASYCAREIFRQHQGFGAWNGWVRNCQGKRLHDVVGQCFRRSGK